jgi:hypothetical protein
MRGSIPTRTLLKGILSCSICHSTRPNRNTEVVRILPETTVLWDNKPWTIVNVGETKVILAAEDEKQIIVELLHERPYSLINHGSIIGLKDDIQNAIDVGKAKE